MMPTRRLIATTTAVQSSRRWAATTNIHSHRDPMMMHTPLIPRVMSPKNNPALLSSSSSQCCCRFFSSSDTTNNAFDRQLKQKQRNNAARSHKAWLNQEGDENEDEDVVDYNYFRQEMAYRLVDRLDDIKRDEGFPLALDIGSGPGYIHRAICFDDAVDGQEGGIGGVRKLVQIDFSEELLNRDKDEAVEGSHRCESYNLHADEEDKLPFPDGTFDLVISSQSMHWVNDLPGLFKEVKRVLKPDGCFMFSMIGGATLPELRISMTLAELEREGGVGVHVGPYVELNDVGSLMQNAGFSLPTIDIDTVRISYPNAFVLMEHLSRMGEGNASLRRRNYTGKDVFLAAACIYDEMFPMNPEGREEEKDVEATAQVINAIGWSPHDTQQRPSKRGSASHRVGEIVEQHEVGDK